MNSKLLHELILHPEKATIEQALLVHELVVKYPFFQTARVLHLKLLSISDYPAFVKQLPLVATYAGDRKKLYYYINPQKQQAVSTPELPNPLSANSDSEVVDRSSLANAADMEPNKNLKEETESSEVQIVGEKKEKSETLSFAQWLDSMASNSLEEMAPRKEISISKKQYKEEKTNELHRPDIGLTNERWSLIDSFLKEYRPSTPKSDPPETKESKEVMDLSIQKTVEEKEIITETLAQIFLAQKNYEKAIEIFEKLGLKYPEKNVYFAGLIKKARKQKNKEFKKKK